MLYDYISAHQPHPPNPDHPPRTLADSIDQEKDMTNNDAYDVRIDEVELGGNVAYGVGQNEVEMKDNEAYTTTATGGGAGVGEEYDYITRTDDIPITATPNEAYGTVKPHLAVTQ